MLDFYTCNCVKCSHIVIFRYIVHGSKKPESVFSIGNLEATISEASSEDCGESLEDLEDSEAPLELSVCVSCECKCCVDITNPYHPWDVSDSKLMHVCQSKERREGKLDAYSRKIQPSWYEKYPWVSVCTSILKIFFNICRHAMQ